MRAIFFDLDGTLLRFSKPYRDVLADAFESVCGAVRDEWLDAYDEAFRVLFAACESDPVRRAFARTGAPAEPDAFAGTLLEREIAACSPPSNVHADLERLADRDRHVLGVLTNGVSDWQRRKLRAHGLDRHFDAVVASYDRGVGAHKPATAPYRAAEDRLPADDYVMIGDSEDDVAGASRAGWRARRYDGGGFGALLDALGGE